MSQDSTSLDLLHDIVEPAAAPLWPPAPGWQVLLGVAVLLMLLGAFHLLVRWQANRYRREALAEFKRIAAEAQGAKQLMALSELLKRTAISAYTRPKVAGLSGERWFHFLDRSGSTRFSDGLGALLEMVNYGEVQEMPRPEQFKQLLAEVRRWIVEHDRDIAPEDLSEQQLSSDSSAAREAA